MGRYDFKELRENALNTRSQDDIDALGEWFDHYGKMCWNGEVYDADGFYIKPVYTPIAFEDSGEPCDWDVVGYDLIF